jgi:hypothetical protein
MSSTVETERLTQPGPIDKPRHFLALAADGDRYSIPVELAVRTFRPFEPLVAYLDQLGKVLGKLQGWLEAHQDAVDRAYLTTREDRLHFVVVRKAVRHDEALSSELTDLDLAIAQDENLRMIELHVLTVSPVSDDGLRAFFNPAESLELRPRHA